MHLAESRSSLYTVDTKSTEVSFKIMSPYASKLASKITFGNSFTPLTSLFNEDNISKLCFDYRNNNNMKMAINHVYLIDRNAATFAF